MNRTIKFRAWDTHTKAMVPFCEIKEGNAEFSIVDQRGNHINNRLVPMQFTGLKDKNGKEIYEGDVVRRDKLFSDATFKIVWNDIGAYGWYAEDFEEHLHGTYLHNSDRDWTVIGNIYENPDLI